MSLTGMEYKTLSYAFIGLAGLFVWALAYWRFFKKAQIYLPKGKKSWFLFFIRLCLFCVGIVAWLLISYSMTGPRRPMGQVKNQIEVNDIFMVIDTSASMKAEDLSPNRMEASKKKVLEFLELHPNDRIGIIVFSERAFTLLPLTTDLKLVKQVVPEIEMGFLGSGTNIGDALALAVARGSQSLAKNKVIVLLTDGVNNVGTTTPLQAAEQARDQKMKVYTIGIGGDKDARMPVDTPFGRQYSTLPGGSVDMKTMEQIASITGGKAFQATNEKALKSVLQEIERLEKTKVDVSGRIVYDELYWKFLFYGVLLLMGVELTRRFVIREGA